MEATSASTVNTGPQQNVNGDKTSEAISLKETPVKIDLKESSIPLNSDTHAFFKDSSSKTPTSKEKKIFQKSSKKRNAVTIPENSCEIKEVPSVIVEDEHIGNPSLTIEINEEERKTPSPKKRGRKKKENFAKSDGKEKLSILRGYNPFVFYEKEKFKGINFKEINQREYVRQISAQWRKMSEKEKEPYLKMAVDFTNNVIQNGDEALMAKKRKKTKKKEKKEGKEDKEEKKEKESKEEKEGKEGKEEKIGKEEKEGKSDKVHIKKEKEKKYNSNSADEKKIKKNKCDVDVDDKKEKNGEFLEHNYICSVVVPFVKQSYEYFCSKGVIEEHK